MCLWIVEGPPVSSHSNDNDEVTSNAIPANGNISQSTIIHWMNIFGCNYGTTRKHFYNKKREDPMIIADQWRFILRHLFRCEPRTHRWIHIPKAEAGIMREHNCVPEDAGYEFACSNDYPSGMYRSAVEDEENMIRIS